MRKSLLPLFAFILLATACSASNEPQETTGTKLQTYQSSEYGFGFEYPEEWSVKSTESSYSTFEEKIVAFELPQSAYPGTNFGDATFSVSVQPSESLEACLSEALSIESSEPFGVEHFETVNGVSYYLSTGSGAAAGNLYDSKYDRTYRDGLCFEIIETVHTTNIENYEPGTVNVVNESDVWNRVDALFQSFTFESYNFDFKYGIGPVKNELNTSQGTFTKDMIVDTAITVSLELTEEELKRVQDKVEALDLEEDPVYGDVRTLMTPCETYSFDSTEWDCNEMTADRTEFVDFMMELIESQEEYQAFPEPQGGYM